MNLDIPGDDPIAELSKAVRHHLRLADQAKADVQAALPVLTETLNRERAARTSEVSQVILQAQRQIRFGATALENKTTNQSIQ